MKKVVIDVKQLTKKIQAELMNKSCSTGNRTTLK